MSEFEDKLNAILSSPDTMKQIAALANSLSGKSQDRESVQKQEETEEKEKTGPSGIETLLSGMDPSVLSRILSLFQEYQSGKGEKQALLAAMKPFLKEKSQEKVEKAIRITQLSHVIRTSMSLFRGDSHV